MEARYSLEQIRKYWEQQSLDHGQAASASWSDTNVIEMEIREILHHLNDGDRVLEVGCANGYTSAALASQRNIVLDAIDYVPAMVQSAQQRLTQLPALVRDRIRLNTSSATQLCFTDNCFDRVLSVRVIINLGSWERQLTGLRECLRVLKPGGTLLLSEATLQGWEKLNQFRNEWGLEPIPIPGFNNYLDQDLLIQSLENEAELIQVVDFASTYYVATRVIKPLLATLTGQHEKIVNAAMEWNRFFSQAPSFGDYGTQKLFVFQKR